MERKSLRWKKVQQMRSERATSMGSNNSMSGVHPMKNPADLEMNLQVSRARQTQVLQEIEKLREIKNCMEEAKAKGMKLECYIMSV